MTDAWRRNQSGNVVEDSALVRGRRYGDWDAELEDLRRRGEAVAYIALLQECISATERESCAWAAAYGSPLATPAKYTLAAAVAYRKAGRLDLEIAVLTRYLAVPGNRGGGVSVAKRLAAAHRFAERSLIPEVADA